MYYPYQYTGSDFFMEYEKPELVPLDKSATAEGQDGECANGDRPELQVCAMGFFTVTCGSVGGIAVE